MPFATSGEPISSPLGVTVIVFGSWFLILILSVVYHGLRFLGGPLLAVLGLREIEAASWHWKNTALWLELIPKTVFGAMPFLPRLIYQLQLNL